MIMPQTPDAKLQSLGLTIPEAPSPSGAYVPVKRVGDLLFVSGQGPLVRGRPTVVGKVDADVSVETAQDAARICVLNCLGAVLGELSCLSGVKEIVQVRGFVNSSENFFQQARVLDAASELLLDIFGEAGRHARAAVGVASLPLCIPVEIEMVVRASQQQVQE